MSISISAKSMIKKLPDKKLLEYTNYGNGKTKSKIFDEFKNCILEKQSFVEKNFSENKTIWTRKKYISTRLDSDAFGNKIKGEGRLYKYTMASRYYTKTGEFLELKLTSQEGCTIPSVAPNYFCNSLSDKIIKTTKNNGSTKEEKFSPQENFWYSKKIENIF